MQKIISLFGLFGLVAIIYLLGAITHPMFQPSLVFWHSLAGYFLIFVVFMSGQTLLENVVIIGMISLILLAVIFFNVDTLSDDNIYLIWSLLSAAWYIPIFLYSLLVFFDIKDEGCPPRAKN